MGPIRYAVREPVELATLQSLFRVSWESGEKQGYDRVLVRSFTWLTAHDGDDLVGRGSTAQRCAERYGAFWAPRHPPHERLIGDH